MSFLSNGYWLTIVLLLATTSQAFVLTPSFGKFKVVPCNWQDKNWNFRCTRRKNSLRLKSDDEDEDEDEEEELEISGDWRAFRAKMVMSEKSSSATKSEEEEEMMEEEDLDGIGDLFSSDVASTTSTKKNEMAKEWNLDGEQWAYDSGKVIEQGAVILGGVEQAFGFGLRQQYFHKVVILVLSHEATFTRGIILNRPSESLLTDKENDVRWRVWFGGDVQGLNSLNPEIVCLHSLTTDKVSELSTPVMNDIQVSSFIHPFIHPFILV